MRKYNKLFCDFCGKFVRKTTENENKLIEKYNKMGSVFILDVMCGECKFKMLTGKKLK